MVVNNLTSGLLLTCGILTTYAEPGLEKCAVISCILFNELLPSCTWFVPELTEDTYIIL